MQGLLEHNAKVYCCSRNAEKTMAALDRLKSVTGKDTIYFIKLDLGDLPSCAQAAKELKAKEPKIDLLFLNAYTSLSNHPDNSGVMVPPVGSKTTQGYDMQWVQGFHNSRIYFREQMSLDILYLPSLFYLLFSLPPKQANRTRLALCSHRATATIYHQKGSSISTIPISPSHPTGPNTGNQKLYLPSAVNLIAG
jgi:NAD(P)-dependent dehydrogenase (short-subunit alcohol dehydrogenase family)